MVATVNARIVFFMIPSLGGALRALQREFPCQPRFAAGSRSVCANPVRKKRSSQANQSAKVEPFRERFIGPLKLNGYESLSISSRYP
jgi:hypothetical protein